MKKNNDGKSIKMSEFLSNFNQKLFDAAATTVLTATINSFLWVKGEKRTTFERGHMVWVEERLPEWEKLLNEKSGGEVISVSLQKGEIGYAFDRDYKLGFRQKASLAAKLSFKRMGGRIF